MDKTDQISLGIDADTTGLTKGKAVVNQFIDDTVKGFSRVDEVVKKSVSSFDSLSGEYSKTRSRLREFLAEQIRAGRTIDENGNVITAHGVKARNLSEQYQRLQREYSNVATSSEKLSNQLGKIDAEIKEGVNSSGRLKSSLDSLGKEADSASGNISNLANSAKTDLNRIDKAATKTSQSLSGRRGLSSRLTSIGKSFRLQKGAIQQAGFQVQDFAVQVQGGTSALVAFSQQGSQLAGVLGPGGAVLGAVIAVTAAVAGPFIASFFKAGRSVDDLKERLEELAKTKLLTKEQAEFLADVETKTISEKEKLISKIEKEIAANEKLNRERASAGSGGNTGRSAALATQSAAANQKSFADAIEKTNSEILEQKADLSLVKSELKEAEKRIQEYNQAIVGGTKRTKEQSESIRGFIASLNKQVQAITMSDREIALSRKGLLEGEKKAINAAFDAIEANKEKVKQSRIVQAEELKQANALKAVSTALDRKIGTLSSVGASQDAYNARLQLGLSQEQALPEAIQKQITKISELSKLKDQETEKQAERDRVLSQFSDITAGKSELDLIQERFVQQRDLTLAHQAIMLEDETLNDLQIADIKRQHEATLTGIEDEAAKAREKIAQREQQRKLRLVSGAFKNIGALMNTESKRLFNIGKAASLAGALVDAYAAVTSSYAAGAKIGGPPLGAAFGVAAGIAQAVNIANIKKQKIGGGTTANAGSFSGGVPSVNTSQGQGGQVNNQNITIAGIDPNSLFSGSQVRGLFDVINGGISDGLSINFA